MELGSDKSTENCKYQPGLPAQVVTLTTQETKIRGTQVQGPPELQKELEASLYNGMRSCLKVTSKKSLRGLGSCSVVEHLPGLCGALGIPGSTNTKVE